MNREISPGLSYLSTPVRGRDDEPFHDRGERDDHHQPTAAGPGAPTRTSRSRWLALYVLCLGDLMIVLDQSIVNVALPSIRTDLGFSQASLAWVVNAYLLTFGGFLLLSGRLGDLLGNKRVFLGGVVSFTIASAVCGLAPSASFLVVGRAVQGLGRRRASPRSRWP